MLVDFLLKKANYPAIWQVVAPMDLAYGKGVTRANICNHFAGFKSLEHLAARVS